VLECPSKLNLGTITEGFNGTKVFLDQISQNLEFLSSEFKKRNLKPLSEIKFLWLESASPSRKTSWTGMVTDFFLLKEFNQFHNVS
jgi:hypothetical protein